MGIVTTKLDEKLFVTSQISVDDLAEKQQRGINLLSAIAPIMKKGKLNPQVWNWKKRHAYLESILFICLLKLVQSPPERLNHSTNY